jgi:hypothetical protein
VHIPTAYVGEVRMFFFFFLFVVVWWSELKTTNRVVSLPLLDLVHVDIPEQGVKGELLKLQFSKF